MKMQNSNILLATTNLDHEGIEPLSNDKHKSKIVLSIYFYLLKHLRNKSQLSPSPGTKNAFANTFIVEFSCIAYQIV